MRRQAILFLAAIFLPTLGLAWLALRSLQDQQLAYERQTALYLEEVATATAAEADAVIETLQAEFQQAVDHALTEQDPLQLAQGFHGWVQANWREAQIGFAVSIDGRLLAPQTREDPAAERFRADNALFLCNNETANIYLNNRAQYPNALVKDPSVNPQQLRRKVIPQQQVFPNQMAAQGESQDTQQAQVQESQNWSSLQASEAEFQQLIGDNPSGTLARFLQNQLNLLSWYRPESPGNLVFGARLHPERVRERIRQLDLARALQPAPIACLAVLDDRAQVVATSHPGFSSDWSRPFVAVEIGEALPHWEVAAYLLDPAALHRNAATARLTLGSLIGILVLAVTVGGWLIMRDYQRQALVARQKTDFVSNVSHELKTPLTSIRMFAELLADQPEVDPVKRKAWLDIISTETGRLARLINNVLDFSRLERGRARFQTCALDLGAWLQDRMASQGPALEQAGFQVSVHVPAEPVPVEADPDALAQILLNLLSNAEKYSPTGHEIEASIETWNAPSGPRARLFVRDRGPGVPSGAETRIFEQFFRCADSLSDAIPGCGLGLTLSRQMARAHRGDLFYRPRTGGGAEFFLDLPLAGPSPAPSIPS